jgi:NTE family protein
VKRAFAALLASVAVAIACRPAPPPVLPPVAMRDVPPRVGLALGGGGARGFAHIGVLRVFEQEKIPLHVLVGSSVGSLIGALYADSGRVLDAEFLAAEVERDDIFDFGALAVFSGGLARGAGIESFLAEHLKHATFESMPVRFGAVATELATGRTVVFERGSVAQGVRASCAIPGVFSPVEIGGTVYVDGSVTDPVPADAARARGAEVVVAVAIPSSVPSDLPSTPVGVALRAIGLLANAVQQARAAEADVVISPEVGGIAYDDFTAKKRAIEAGEDAARRALPAIRAAIAAKTRHEPVPPG